MWKSYGQKVLEFSSFSSRESSRPRLLLLDDDDLPKKLYYWVLCKSDLKHLNFCVSVAWFPFFALLWPRGQKLTPENYLFTFFPSLPLFFSFSFNSKYLKISFTANQTSPFIFYTKQNSNLSLVIYNSLWKELILRLLHTTKWIIANSRDNSNKLQNVNEFRVQC